MSFPLPRFMAEKVENKFGKSLPKNHAAGRSTSFTSSGILACDSSSSRTSTENSPGSSNFSCWIGGKWNGSGCGHSIVSSFFSV